MTKDNDVKQTTWMPSELRKLVVFAAARATIESGKRVSASEWIRRAIRAALDADGPELRAYTEPFVTPPYCGRCARYAPLSDKGVCEDCWGTKGDCDGEFTEAETAGEPWSAIREKLAREAS